MMNPIPELTPQLKQLRLSGMLETLEARNRQAIESKLSHLEFLSILVGDEVARRDQKKFGIRLKRAQFRSSKTLDHFDFERLPNLNRSLIHELATCRFIQEKSPVLIAGPSGTGKSHLAQALGHAAVRQGYSVIFIACSTLTQSMQLAKATGAYKRRFSLMTKADLLIIDDFGLKPIKNPHDEDLHDIIAERYERQTTIVTSNLDFPEWDQALPGNHLLASATLDRLRHNAYCLLLDGQSYRTPRIGAKISI